MADPTRSQLAIEDAETDELENERRPFAFWADFFGHSRHE